jgi:hypothetical protein
MDRFRKPVRVAFCLMLCAPVWFAHAHTLPDADRMVTLELAASDVEKLAGQIEAIPVTVIDGVSISENSCAPAVRSNTSLEQVRER